MSLRQRAERHVVRAEAIGERNRSLPSVRSGGEHAHRTTVRWAEPGKGARTATARVPAGTRQGDIVEVRLDAHGRNVPPPVDGNAVRLHALATGLCARAVRCCSCCSRTVWCAGSPRGVAPGRPTASRQVALRRRPAEAERAWAARNRSGRIAVPDATRGVPRGGTRQPGGGANRSVTRPPASGASPGMAARARHGTP
ncbi:hypothetical protein ACIPM2_13850 [Streptomyces sp. NPDC086081]|uniref:hypothetical protein n=1 Tax=Streptomyces sp. NPDC086081 TaxID=3365749 RepID=UPI00381B1FDB